MAYLSGASINIIQSEVPSPSYTRVLFSGFLSGSGSVGGLVVGNCTPIGTIGALFQFDVTACPFRRFTTFWLGFGWCLKTLWTGWEFSTCGWGSSWDVWVG